MNAKNSSCAAHAIDSHSRVCQLDERGNLIPFVFGAAQGMATMVVSVRLWRCSDCGTEAPWSPKHSFRGALECRQCQGMVVNHVSCGCKQKD